MTIALLYFQDMRLYPNSLSLKTQEKLLCLSQPEHVTIAIEKVRKKHGYWQKENSLRLAKRSLFILYLISVLYLYHLTATLRYR